MKKQLTILFLLATSTLPLRAQSIDLNQGQFINSNYFIELPFEKVRGKLIVTIGINEESRKFIFDTAAPTAISQEMYKKLNSKIVSKEEISDVINQKDSLIVVRIDKMQLGEAIFIDIPAIVIKQGVLTECFQIDGLIGSNLLRNSIVQFDDRNGVIRITDNLDMLTIVDVNQSDIMLDRQSTPILKINIGKYVSEMLLFDSGSDEFYSMSTQNMKKFKKSKVFDIIAKSEGTNLMGIYGVEESSETYRLSIPTIFINGIEIRNMISETNSDINSRIGRQLLNYGIFTIDYLRKKSYFQPYTLSQEFNETFWDISPTFIDGRLAIGKIWSKELKKVEIGDQILAVNDINTGSITICELLMDSPFKNLTKATLKVKSKNGEVYTITIEKVNHKIN